MNILSVIQDERLAATSIMMEMTFREYLQLVENAIANLDIQRGVVRGFKPYDRLREDLRQGCLVPAPVIAVRQGALPTLQDENVFMEQLQNVPHDQVYIVDGVQRTNALIQVRDGLTDAEAMETFSNRVFRVELWPDISTGALTYRMILLNAGQKPMSLKHQLEVVSAALCAEIEDQLGDRIDIRRAKDTERRARPGQYQFSLLAQAFQAFVRRNPHIDIRNDVIDELSQLDVLEGYGNTLGEPEAETPNAAFLEYVGFLVDLDHAICRVYANSREVDGITVPSGRSLLSRDTFHLGLSAAFAWCRAYKGPDLEYARALLLQDLEQATPGTDDPLALERLEKIQTGFSRKDNVGEQTRKLIFNGFKEYFSSGGRVRFADCWVYA